jgi:peptidyl-prolyl cis-trans isomerase D
MQKHNKYLIVTIWIATIAFIGAGFVGWGSYQYGSKAGSIAKVGNIDITREKFDISYRNLYQRYNQMLRGQLDDKKAQELGIAEQTFTSLAREALLLNLAQEFGIVVSDEEIFNELSKIPSFQKDKIFDKSIYSAYLKSQRISAKSFESMIHDQTVIQKLFDLLDIKGVPFEDKVILSALNIADKIAYRVLSTDDVNITTDDTEIKKYWEEHKSSYMTKQKYQLDILWKDSSDANVTEVEIENFYKENSFNYIDKDGQQLSIDSAKDRVVSDLKMKKSKKDAQKLYIKYKKGKISKSESVVIEVGGGVFDSKIWEEIKSKDINSILKPKAVDGRYAIIRISNIVEPREMNFDEAKEIVASEYKETATKEALDTLAETTLKNFDEKNATISDFLTLNRKENLKPLNMEKTTIFLKKLFTSQKEKGIISINKKIVVYKILEQKMVADLDDDMKKFIKNSVNQIKSQDLQSNIIKSLGERYEIQKFAKGI